MKPVVLLCALLCAFASLASARQIDVGVIPGQLKFDFEVAEVAAGEPVELVFTNNGIMFHNLVVTQPGAMDEIVTEAMALGATGMEKNYIPDNGKIIAHSGLLAPKAAETISFTAPTQPGDYGIVCTFPGHGHVMRAILRVRPRGAEIKPVERVAYDVTVVREALGETTVTPRPLGTQAVPLIMRTFMPNPGFDTDEVLAHHDVGLPAPRYNPSQGRDVSGTRPAILGIPAAVGVNFGPSFSYCWDTTECRLLYAWTGGFLDMEVYWGGGTGGGRKGFDYVPRLMGQYIFRTAGAHPVRVGSATSTPDPVYLGYRLVGNAPEFAYSIGGAKIYELVAPGDDQSSFERRIRVENNEEPVFVSLDGYVREQTKISAGTWQGDTLVLTPEDAREFTLTIETAPFVSQMLDHGTHAHAIPPEDLPERGGVISNVARKRDGNLRPAPKVLHNRMGPGAPVFVDREYTYGRVPEALHGADVVLTYNDDKEDDTRGMRYEVTVDKPATLYFLLDTRVGQVDWIDDVIEGKGLKPATHRVSTNDGFDYQVHAAEVEPGTYTFGNQTGGSFYTVLATRR